MNKTKVALTTVTILTSLVLGQKVFGETLNPVGPDATSNGTVQFEESKDDKERGQLRINAVSAINFGTVDNRGNNAGWQLQVAQTRQFTQLDENNQVEANPTLENGQILAGSVLSLTSKSSVLDTPDPDRVAPAGFKKVDLTETAQTAVNASTDTGMGTWDHLFGEEVTDSTDKNSNVQLTIPGKIKKNKDVKYEAELTWSVLATPEV
ncbi:WxL domain-containing protein [Vagococcus salmoninarum]|uniref:WxL domain-containing protein n=1 Tax=Vagococcus salmoninarum TaxID=2739 RepID=UPI003F9734E0